MPGTTIESVLNWENLTGAIQEIKGGVSADLLPAAFMKATRKIPGNTCTYDKIQGNRQTARIAQYGSPSARRQLKGISKVPVTLLHTSEHIMHETEVLQNLRDVANPARQTLGKSEIGRQLGHFKRLFTNLRVACVYSALATGHIYFDGDGNLLSSSSGNVVDVDFGIPAANIGTSTTLCTTAGKWSAAATNIVLQVDELKTVALKASGYPLTEAFYGSSILGYLMLNTQLKEMIYRNAGWQSTFSGGMIPDGFLGLNWHKMADAFYEDDDGDNASPFVADKITFTPAPSPEWYEVVEGSMPVPKDIGNIATDATAMLANIGEAFGMYAYAQLTSDPIGIKQVIGDNFLPLIKVPGAVYIMDTDWT